MFADKLRKSVLQAAIQGQLTEQLPTDGDAKDLLKKIQAEKAELVKAKKIKAQPPLPPISDDELPFTIPANWCWVRLGNIALKIHYGYTASANLTGNVKLLRITDIQEDKVIWDNVPRCTVTDSQKKEYLLQNGDIVIARTGGTIGKTFIVENLPEDVVFASYLIRIIFNEKIISNYIKYFSGSPLYWKQIRNSSKGTGQPNVKGKSLNEMILPLPPLAEQKRIVAKLDALLAEIDLLARDERELIELEENFPLKMKKSLLQAAIQGQLTEQLPTDGDAKDLLKKIQAEKAKLIKEKKIKAQPPLPPISDDELPFAIPANWCWVRLDDICKMFTGNSISESEKNSKYRGQSDGLDFIATKDISLENVVTYDNGVKIPLPTELKKAQKNSVLMCLEGGSAGRKIAILDRAVCFGNKLCNFNAYLNFNRYLYYYLQSPAFRKIFSDQIVGIIGGVGINKLRNFLIPLPPLAEQERIVARLDELLPLCEI